MEGWVKAKLKDLVGAANFSDRLIDLVSYSYDASDEEEGRPGAAVWPLDTHQVSQVLALANSESIPLVTRGAGTGLSGMAVPQGGGIVLDLSRMNRITEIKVEDRLAIVEPGVVYADLQRALAPFGFFFPPDPASGSVCTLGGNVASNAGGMKGVKYGVTRDYVLGLEVVLPDGRVMHTGSRCMKSVSGYDMTRLLVGSEGTLGVFTRIILRIAPRPPATATAVGYFAELEAAGTAVSRIVREGIVPSVLEVLDEVCVEILRSKSGLEIPSAEALLLVETDGNSLEDVDLQMDRVVAILRDCGAERVKKAATLKEAEQLWDARRSIGVILARLRPNFMVEDISVPLSRVPEMLRTIRRIAQDHGVSIATMGHAGDGNLHPAFVFDGEDRDESNRVKRAVAALFELAVEMDGTISGEHGIGLSKAAYLSLEHDPVAVSMMRTLKHAFDPKNILNPGKMGL